MTKKEQWIKKFTTGKFEKADPQVLEFIIDFAYSNDEIADGIYDLFSNGYCYYFAVNM